MNVLFVGDLYGKSGRKALAVRIREMVRKTQSDAVIVNGENMSGGKGLDAVSVKEILDLGADVITTGNHVWAKKDFRIEDHPRVLRPANYSDQCPGKGFILIEKNGERLAVVNLSGRVFMEPCNCPFDIFQKMLPDLKKQTKAILVDFHGEATSEKAAFAWHFDGMISAVVGTHTHVQTADERILPLGTGFITDAGLTGPREGIIGADREKVIHRFITGYPAYFEPQKGPAQINGVFLRLSGETGRCTFIERIQIHEEGGDI